MTTRVLGCTDSPFRVRILVLGWGYLLIVLLVCDIGDDKVRVLTSARMFHTGLLSSPLLRYSSTLLYSRLNQIIDIRHEDGTSTADTP